MMVNTIFLFLCVSIGASLIQMKVPLFGRNHKRWEKQNYIQRFSSIFIPIFIALVILFLFDEYKTSQSPTMNEQMLMNGTKYCLVTDKNEIGDADFAYEIKSGTSQENICEIISDICINLKKGNDSIYARFENGEYIIISNKITIGRVAVYDKTTTTLLKIYFYNQ
jgi:magnesium-transporting ATPase (P-type)